MLVYLSTFCFFLCTDPAPSEIYPLSLHDALPILLSACLLTQLQLALLHVLGSEHRLLSPARLVVNLTHLRLLGKDRKSTRLNSSHVSISYAVFCLKKKKKSVVLQLHSLALHH